MVRARISPPTILPIIDGVRAATGELSAPDPLPAALNELHEMMLPRREPATAAPASSSWRSPDSIVPTAMPCHPESLRVRHRPIGDDRSGRAETSRGLPTLSYLATCRVLAGQQTAAVRSEVHSIAGRLLYQPTIVRNRSSRHLRAWVHGVRVLDSSSARSETDGVSPQDEATVSCVKADRRTVASHRENRKRTGQGG